jgi:hypothetical protein
MSAHLPNRVAKQITKILSGIFGGRWNGTWWKYMYAIGYIYWQCGIFNVHLVYLMSFWYIQWPFGILNGQLVYFSHFGMLNQVKSGNPSSDALRNYLLVFLKGLLMYIHNQFNPFHAPCTYVHM